MEVFFGPPTRLLWDTENHTCVAISSWRISIKITRLTTTRRYLKNREGESGSERKGVNGFVHANVKHALSCFTDPDKRRFIIMLPILSLFSFCNMLSLAYSSTNEPYSKKARSWYEFFGGSPKARKSRIVSTSTLRRNFASNWCSFMMTRCTNDDPTIVMTVAAT